MHKLSTPTKSYSSWEIKHNRFTKLMHNSTEKNSLSNSKTKIEGQLAEKFFYINE